MFFLAAAKVGGIVANNNAPADFMYQNMMLEMNVINSAWRNGCKKLLFLGSSCIYPRMAPQPMKEECLLTSALEPTNEAYALAKISGLRYCQYLKRQYGADLYRLCPPICTVQATTTIPNTHTCYRHLSDVFTKQKQPVLIQLRAGATALR